VSNLVNLEPFPCFTVGKELSNLTDPRINLFQGIGRRSGFQKTETPTMTLTKRKEYRLITLKKSINKSLMVLMILVFVLTSCAGNDERKNLTEGNEKITITFAALNAVPERYETLIQTFETQYPYIHIKILPSAVMGMDEKQLSAQADTLLLGGVVSAENRSLYLDLTPLMSDKNFEPDSFWPNSLKGCQIGGEQVGLPVSLYPSLILYNKEIFDQWNIPYPQPDWNWDTFRGVLQTLSASKGTTSMIGYLDSSAGFLLRPESYALFAENITPTTYKDAVQWYLEVAKHGSLVVQGVNTEQDYNSLIESQQTAMWAGTLSSVFDYLKRTDFEIGFVPFPAERSRESGTTPMNINCAVVSAGSSYPTESWTWLNFLAASNMNLGNADLPAKIDQLPKNLNWQSLTSDQQSAIIQTLEQGWYGWINHDFSPLRKAFQQSIQSGQDLVDLLPQDLDLKTYEWEIPQRQDTPVAVVHATQTPPPAEEPAEKLTAVYFAEPSVHTKPSEIIALAKAFNNIYPEFNLEVKNQRIGFENINSFTYDLQNYDCFIGPAGGIHGDDDDGAAYLDQLLPLDPFFEMDGISILDDLDPDLLESVRVDGVFYGIPLSVNPLLVYYNADLLQELGLNPPGLDWTADDFWGLAQEAAQKNEDIYGYVPVISNEPEYYFSQVAYFKLKNGVAAADFKNPQLVNLLNRLQLLAKDHTFFVYDSGGTRSAMGNYMQRDELIRFGNGLFWVDTTGSGISGSNPDGSDFKIETAVYPGNQAFDSSDIITFYISRQAENPQVCWAWAKMLTEPGNYVFEGIPLNASIWQSEQWAQTVGEEQASVYRAAQARLEYSTEMGYFLPAPLSQWWADVMAAVLQDGRDVETVLQETQYKAQALLDCMQAAGYPVSFYSEEAGEAALACAHQVDPEYHSFMELWSINP